MREAFGDEIDEETMHSAVKRENPSTDKNSNLSKPQLKQALISALGAGETQTSPEAQQKLNEDGRSRTNSMINSESNKVIGHMNLDTPMIDKDTYD